MVWRPPDDGDDDGDGGGAAGGTAVAVECVEGVCDGDVGGVSAASGSPPSDRFFSATSICTRPSFWMTFGSLVVVDGAGGGNVVFGGKSTQSQASVTRS